MKTILLLLCTFSVMIANSQESKQGDSINHYINLQLNKATSSKSISDKKSTRHIAYLKDSKEIVIIDVFGTKRLNREMFYFSKSGDLIKLIVFAPVKGEDEMRKSQYYIIKGQAFYNDGYDLKGKEITSLIKKASKVYLKAKNVI